MIPNSLPAPLPTPVSPLFPSRVGGRPESKGLELSLVLKGSKWGWGMPRLGGLHGALSDAGFPQPPNLCQ